VNFKISEYFIINMLFPSIKRDGIQSPIKWAGGKTLMFEYIEPLLKNNKNVFVECFAGSLAITLEFQPRKVIINDICFPLINMWVVIKDFPDELCNTLEIYADNTKFNNETKFYDIRNKFNKLKTKKSLTNNDKILLAVYFIYLNKRSFNGLYRENKKGEYNVPFRHYENCEMYDVQNIKNISKYFNENDVTFFNDDFSRLVIPENSLVYLDPPYYPVSKNSFTQYTKYGFTKEKQQKLLEFCNDLNKRKISFIQSNSPCEEIIEMYSNYNMEMYYISRSMRSAKKGIKNGEIKDNEILIWN